MDQPPRLDAVEACAATPPAASALPVPHGDRAEVGLRDGAGWHPGTLLCDLPSRIVVLAAQQTVHGKGGTAWTIARPGGNAAAGVQVLPSSKGCVEGEVTCSWTTASADTPTIETLRNPPWVPTSGWVHGVEDMCRALPDDTIAVCSTARRLAYVEVGCQKDPAGPVALQLGLHDESLPRNYDLDVEVPVARLYGQADPPDGDRWTYRFTGAAAPAKAALTIDLAAHTGVLELDGVREDCIAFGLYRR